jgi:hypothetical protein
MGSCSSKKSLDDYFLEYQRLCYKNPQKMCEDLEKWKEGDKICSIISIQHAAIYADYVTTHAIKDGNDKELTRQIKIAINHLESFNKDNMTSCILGNTACIALCHSDKKTRKLATHLFYLLQETSRAFENKLTEFNEEKKPLVNDKCDNKLKTDNTCCFQSEGHNNIEMCDV